MSRVELLEAGAAPLSAAAYYPAEGGASPLVRALAQVPELLEVTVPFVGRLFGPTSIDQRTKELVILRVSARNACRYCVETHTVAAWDAGLSIDETRALCGDGAGLDGRERTLVRWCDAIAGSGPVPDALVEELRGQASEHEMVELTLLAAATVMLNRLCTALELPTSPGTLARLREADAR
ncbi:MAG: carboxymuconolactone decarboxylase family protein [Solirubrobacteraceae bacterium]